MGISLKFTLFYVGIIIVVISFGQFVNGDQECLNGVNTTGYTVPKGDIVIRYGEPLDIYCILNENAAKSFGPNASQKLTFTRGTKNLNSEMIQVINETTIKLHVEKPAKGNREYYICTNKFEKKKYVCANFVYVGVPPQEITDFRCVSENLDNLTCRWTAPQNYIVTTYNLTYSLDPDSEQFKCPQIEGEEGSEMKCTWNLGTAPIYRQSVSEYYFSLTANNTFGNYTMPTKLFKHFEHVIPNKPENLKVISKTWNSVGLSWSIPSTMRIFRSGLHYRVLYQSSYGTKEWQSSPIIPIKEKAEVKHKLENLEFAHAYYDIRVSLRSAVADPADVGLWSDNASLTVLTESKIPDEAPRTNIGSFEILTYGNNSDRNVRIYWSHVPEEKRNGENFTYVVTLEGNEEIENTTENAYLLYERLSPYKSYTFLIRSKNEMGYSDDFSVVKIPTHQNCAREPTRLRKEELDHGYYRLSWQPPKMKLHQPIRNYTIFWCNDEKERPPCTGKLDWIVVPRNKTSHDQRIPSNKTFQFAISANTDHGSSGMTWAHCTDLYYKYSVGKIDEFYRVSVGSTDIKVKWSFGCSDKSVTGFIIYYCPIWSPEQNFKCREPEKNTTVPSNETTATIHDVAPYTTYNLQVAAVINFTKYSQRSEPLLSTTLETAPTAPQILQLTDVTNSTISLSWYAPKKTNGLLKYYQISYNNDSRRIDPVRGAKMQSVTLTNLTSFKNYTISVQACTVTCSEHSEEIRTQTNIGYPSAIRKPIITQNETYTQISWDSPLKPNGRIEYYELKIKEKQDKENKTIILNVTGQDWGFNSCAKEKVFSFFVSVRAINLDGDRVYHGKWSDEIESYCRSPGNYTIYLLVPFIILFLSAMTYLFKRLYGHFLIMKDVEVKLPLGLQSEAIEVDLVNWPQKPRSDSDGHHAADDEKHLLMKKNEGSPTTNIGDSSGCSSAHESVTCSLDSASNISSSTSDSGTEQPKIPSAEDLSDLTTSSLRQRNIRPTSISKPYVVFPLEGSNNSGMKSPPKTYCVLGIDPNLNTEGNSTYIPLPSVMDKASFNSPEPTSPYVFTGELLKTANPSYIPFKSPVPADKNPAYVIAGSKDVISPDSLNLETKQALSPQENAYIKIADNMTLKNSTDITNWQPSSLSTNSKTGYVTIGEIPPLKKESKGYVPHRQLDNKTLKED
ncbi:cytokine receptor [Coccinella septempunctata]|uniref:cytokine receptor n=1 Tax=Coccinella septempunctata TaxID=41139 RepID=UPI001D0730CD|nr:cytokine receptor [Coccinella septempunctata]